MKKIVNIILVLSSMMISVTIDANSAEPGKIPSSPTGLQIGVNQLPTPVPPPSPAGNEGLLTGMTPSKYAIPSGWSLVRTQDFEGSLGAGEAISGSITSARPHGGAKSLQKFYDGADQIGSWNLAADTTSRREVYLSWYEYIEPQATLNTEIFLFRFLSKETNPSTGNWKQNFTAQFYGGPSNYPPLGYNAARGKVVFHSEGGSFPTGNWVEYYEYMNVLDFSTDRSSQGTWRQYEVYYKPNSVVNAVPQEDGKAIMYVNGNLFMETKSCSDTNYYDKTVCVGTPQPNTRNLNGSYDMIGAKINIGGVYTAQKWLDSNGKCLPLASGGTYYNCWDFADCAPCPVPADFNRFIDDIIVMQR